MQLRLKIEQAVFKIEGEVVFQPGMNSLCIFAPGEMDINITTITPHNHELMELIADWYLNEWQIPRATTMQKLQMITRDSGQFQAVMTLDELPVATAGLYNHVSILDREPRLKIHKKWLALVYTLPDRRAQGYGALICKFIQDHAKSSGLHEIHLFTDTAERLYKRLGWTEVERLLVNNRNIIVMNKLL